MQTKPLPNKVITLLNTGEYLPESQPRENWRLVQRAGRAAFKSRVHKETNLAESPAVSPSSTHASGDFRPTQLYVKTEQPLLTSPG